MIPYGKQTILPEDIEAVVAALRSDWLTTGPRVEEFEAKFAEQVGAKYAIAVCNATAALHLALLSAGVGVGDRVVTSPNTFLASANCAAFVGAIPDFADIDPISYNLSPESLECGWRADTKAVIAVDYAGQSADMPRIAAIARDRNAVVIEDACHAVGGQFEHDGRFWNVGGHPWADITTFSFHPVKTMTTGEGGMLVTDDPDYAYCARMLRSHGMERNSERFQGLGDDSLNEYGPWYYEMHQLGYNYRITDFQCALGLSQLSRLDSVLSRRREIVAQYNKAFQALPHLTIPALRNQKDREVASWHLYTVAVDFCRLGKSRSELMFQLRENGIGSQVLYIPVHLQPWYQDAYGYSPDKCPVALDFYKNALSLPLYPSMSDSDVAKVVAELGKLVS